MQSRSGYRSLSMLHSSLVNHTTTLPSYHVIIGFLINLQVQGHHPHQWAPFEVAGLLHAWQISHQISRYVYHESRQLRASTLCNPSLITDLPDHCPVIPLQAQEVCFCQWPSLTGMGHCVSHTRAVHMATCLEREVV